MLTHNFTDCFFVGDSTHKYIAYYKSVKHEGIVKSLGENRPHLEMNSTNYIIIWLKR